MCSRHLKRTQRDGALSLESDTLRGSAGSLLLLRVGLRGREEGVAPLLRTQRLFGTGAQTRGALKIALRGLCCLGRLRGSPRLQLRDSAGSLEKDEAGLVRPALLPTISPEHRVTAPLCPGRWKRGGRAGLPRNLHPEPHTRQGSLPEHLVQVCSWALHRSTCTHTETRTQPSSNFRETF